MPNVFKFSNSERKTMKCPHKWFLTYLLRLRPERVSRPLYFGSIWHEVMSAWWTSRNEHPEDREFQLASSMAKLNKIFQDAISESESSPTRGEFVIGESQPVRTVAQLEEDRAIMACMLQGYHVRYAERDTLRTVQDEAVLEMELTSPAFRDTQVFYTGRLDKLVVDKHKQHWIIEHKTTSGDPHIWRQRNGYDPQVLGYALMCERQYGILPVGVCYDLAKRAKEPTFENYDLVKAKGGKLRISKVLPAGATAISFKRALWYYGFTLDDQPYYREVLERLEEKEDGFFHREWVRFDRLDLARVEHELKAQAAYMLGMSHGIEERIRKIAPESETMEDWRDRAAKQAEAVGWAFPRCSSACYDYNRPCEVMDMCKRPQPMSTAGLTQLDTKHPELVEDKQP